MRLNRKSVTVGLAGLAIAGVLAGGAGMAVAATGTPSAPSSTSSTASPYGHMSGNPDSDGMPGAGRVGHMAGMAFGGNSPTAAAAGYLGLSQTDLQAQLQGGQSFADVAAAQGKPVSGLVEAMLAAITSNLDANTTLTADQLAAHLALVESHLDAMVTAPHSSGAGIGSMGTGMGGMMGR
jgi:hypothetical protein